MNPIRLVAIAFVASCGLLLAAPATSAVIPASPAPNAVTADDADAGGAEPAQYAKRSGDRSRDRRRDRRDFRERDRGHYRWDYDRRERWRTKRHPRRPYWSGRRLPPRGRYMVITNYWDYYLPRPRHGYYYVRQDDDVFLVLEATRMIIDAFILFELLDRR